MKSVSFIKTDKKIRFLLFAILMSSYVFLVTVGPLDLNKIDLLIITSVLLLLGTYLVHFPNVTYRNIIMSMVLPGSLTAGIILFITKFPNFSMPFNLLVIISYGFLYYIVNLSDNIFLVVQDREEVIPLYRVAVTWSQILSSVVAIPLLAGFYKIDVGIYIQIGVIAIYTFLLASYQIWVLRFDKDAKRVGYSEGFLLTITPVFIVSSVNTAISFIPTESFLRALFVSAMLMTSLSYVGAHLKNEITKKFLIQSFSIVLFFLIIALIFNP